MLCEHPGARCYGLEQGGEGGGGKNWSSSGSILNREPTESADELEVGCEEVKRDPGSLDSFRKTVCAPGQTLSSTQRKTQTRSPAP